IGPSDAVLGSIVTLKPEPNRPTDVNTHEYAHKLHRELDRTGHVSPMKMMIATVSDPIESSVDLFDPFLDAIQRAFEAEDFVLDRHDLPWRDAGSGSGESETAHRREPGALLFRRTPENDPPQFQL